jgi:hypothetical protein
MLPKKIILVLVALVMLFGSLGSASPAYADDEVPPPPPPIVITIEVRGKTIGNVFLPSAVVSGPSGQSVTITNRYYPYYGGQVKTDGNAVGNFSQPSGSRYKCQSHVYNNAGQYGTTTTSYGSYGGANCPYTAQAILSGGVVPNTYTSWTKTWFKWSNGTNGYGIAQQSNYQP